MAYEKGGNDKGDARKHRPFKVPVAWYLTPRKVVFCKDAQRILFHIWCLFHHPL